jgi:hypothetical protein
MNLKSERFVRQLFAAHGLNVLAVKRNRHWRVTAQRLGGPELHFTIPVSPSDWRATRNMTAALRRKGV